MPPRDIEMAGRRQPSRLLVNIAVGVAIRIALLVALPGLGGDMDIFRAWARTLTTAPLSEFYAGDATVQRDHLPGDLLILTGVAHVHDLLGLGARGFDVLIKAVAVAADLLVAFLLHRLVRNHIGAEAADRTCTWYLLCPAPLLISAAWGQWDTVSAAIMLAAVHLATRGGRSWIVSAPLITWAVLVKPQLAVIALLLLVLVVACQRRTPSGPSTTARTLAAGWTAAIAASVVVVATLTQAFGLGLWWAPPEGQSLWSVLQEGLHLFPYTTNSAANLWMLVEGAPRRTPDDTPFLGSLTASTVGSLLFVGLLVVLVLGVRRLAVRDAPPRKQPSVADDLTSWCWAAALAMTGAFVLLTRVHERYLFPGLVLMVLMTGLRPKDRWIATCMWVCGVAMGLNIVLAVLANQPDPEVDALAMPFVATSCVQIAVLAAWAVWPWIRPPERLDLEPADASSDVKERR